jgi:hypothetical protein
VEITQYKPTMNTTKIIYNLSYTTICPIFSKVMPKFTKNFGMTFAKKGTYGVPEFAGTEVNRRSGKLKGLSGYLQTFHPQECGGQKTTTTDPNHHRTTTTQNHHHKTTTRMWWPEDHHHRTISPTFSAKTVYLSSLSCNQRVACELLDKTSESNKT